MRDSRGTRVVKIIYRTIRYVWVADAYSCAPTQTDSHGDGRMLQDTSKPMEHGIIENHILLNIDDSIERRNMVVEVVLSERMPSRQTWRCL